MTREMRRGALLTLLLMGTTCVLGAQPALAQGPPNTYEDFPYNQGSLFYRPLKPKPRPRPRLVQPRVNTAPAAAPRGGYTYVQPGTGAPAQGPSSFTARSYGYYNPPRYYYRYQSPAPAAVVRPAPAAPAAATAPAPR